ncbi:MAG TPA: NUDIX domain-containing protein [Gaiellaceae bacterium]|nr:NUDIX domain-containing protein [Gaiellaceae bacterium]
MGRLDEWRFCPRCGEPIEVEERHATCAHCGFEEYGNSAPATEALVLRDGRVLLSRRGIEPHKGKWDLPGGFLEEAEHPLDGVRRELREETGLEIEVHRFLRAGVERYGRQDVLILSWLASAPDGEPEATDDVAELAWLAPDELPAPEEFAFAHHARLLADWAGGTLLPKDEPNGP